MRTVQPPFQPTRPLRGATDFDFSDVRQVFISTHAPLAGRDRGRCAPQQKRSISTHAPLAGRDHNGHPGRHRVRSISTHAPLAGRDSKSVQITMHIFAITDKFQMLLHRMPPVRAFCSFLMQENHADFGCEPPKWSLRACASHYKIIGSSGRYVCLQPKCSILFSYFLPK